MEATNYEGSVTTRIQDGVALLTLTNARQRNALSLEVLRQLDDAVAHLNSADIKVIVLTGAGDVFASGADLKELSQLGQTSAFEFAKRGQTVFQRIADARQVTIAAINGYCFGGALDLALACDIRVASSKASFSHPGARRGIITGWGGTQRLPRIVGRTRALEMFITAGVYSSEEALQMGLISSIGDPVVDLAFDKAKNHPQIPRITQIRFEK